MCSSLTRIVVPRPRHDELVEALAATFSKVRVGDPFAEETQMGPLAAERQRDRVEGYIAKGIEEGATLATGGGRPKDLERGWYVEPTVFGNVDNHSAIATDEIFGPVLTVIPADDEQDAVRIANDTIYGLNASVFTDDADRAREVAGQLRSGTVGQNAFRTDFGMAFGGFKQSGIGREGGKEGLVPFLETKTVILDGTPKGYDEAPSTRPLPELTPANEWFWTSGADGQLRIQVCDDCATAVHPPTPVCPACRSLSWTPTVVSGRATVVARTINRHQWLPDLPPPYAIAIVALAEHPDVRLTTNVVGCEPDEVHIGQEVAVRFEQQEDVYLPLFEPTGSENPTDLVGEPERPTPRPPVSADRFEHRVVLSGVGRSAIGRRLMRDPPPSRSTRVSPRSPTPGSRSMTSTGCPPIPDSRAWASARAAPPRSRKPSGSSRPGRTAAVSSPARAAR